MAITIPPNATKAAQRVAANTTRITVGASASLAKTADIVIKELKVVPSMGRLKNILDGGLLPGLVGQQPEKILKNVQETFCNLSKNGSEEYRKALTDFSQKHPDAKIDVFFYPVADRSDLAEIRLVGNCSNTQLNITHKTKMPVSAFLDPQEFSKMVQNTTMGYMKKVDIVADQVGKIYGAIQPEPHKIREAIGRCLGAIAGLFSKTT